MAKNPIADSLTAESLLRYLIPDIENQSSSGGQLDIEVIKEKINTETKKIISNNLDLIVDAVSER